MIIEFAQKKESIDISYVKDKKIETLELSPIDGYYKYVACDDFDDDKIPGIRSFHGSPIKKVPAHFFSDHNINEFINQDIPLNFPKEHALFSSLDIPNPFSIDIEVIPTQQFGYSPQTEANNPITSISITDSNLESIIFTTKHPDYDNFNDLDMEYINGLVNTALGPHVSKYKYGKAIRFFDNEIDMLNVFLECINKHFHLVIGWNYLMYDWPYIEKRCENLGISIKKASPTGKVTKKNFGKKNNEIIVKIPSHRVMSDYMLLFKQSLVYNNLGSYSLDSIAELILGLNKISYTGNLRKLYNNNFRKFIAYNFIDTILVMLIHKITNLLTVDFFQSYYTGVPYLKLSQNSISEALVYHDLKDINLFLLETEKTGNTYRKYKGGYVKSPLRKIVESLLGIDYGGLYPNGIITTGLTPENKIDSIKVNDDMYPLNETENQKWLKYKEMGYCLTPAGRIYDITKEGLYPRIEKKVLSQRKIFQGYMTDIYLEIIEKIENEIKTR